MMAGEENLEEGARNLLVNCADLKPDESLLIICEDPALGWYDAAAAAAVTAEARKMGITPTLLDVGAPENGRDRDVADAVAAHDCTIFMTRIGDQDRFADPVPGKKSVMCYARDAGMLASAYGRANHRAFMDFKKAIDKILLAAETIQITCPLGTNISGSVSKSDRESPGDVSVHRFPLGVPQPLDASDMSGRVALARYLTPTGSKVYQPAYMAIDGTVYAEVSRGRILDLTGDEPDVSRIREHHRKVADKFAIDGDIVHSFHAGIHPGCAYTRNAAENPDRWSNSVFTNPRVLHFHTCGNYAPGEICWVVIDHTVSVDGKTLWENGRLRPVAFEATRNCLDHWPELEPLFANPSRSVGLAE
jgi:hypothetical protein